MTGTAQRRWSIRTAVVAAAFCATLASCSGLPLINAGSIADNEPTETIDMRRVLRTSHDLSWGGDESLDPSSASPMTWATTLLYDGLVGTDATGEPIPGLALEWYHNIGATEWRFVLAEGVRFHDGTLFDGHDVKYTFERIATSDSSPIASSLATLERVDVARDGAIVTFHLSERSLDFPRLLTDRRMRVLSSESPIGIGTGPFQVTTFDPANTTFFSSHDDYFRGKPKLAGVEIIAMPEAKGRLAAMEAGRLDLLADLSANDVEFLEERPEFLLQRVPSGDWRGIVFDTSVAPYDDPRVLQAFKLLIDRQEMIELVAGGRSGAEVSCDSPIWSNDPYYVSMVCPPNVERARELLTEAGYGDGLDVTITTSSLYSDWIPLAEVFQYQAAQVGVRVTIDVADADGYWTDVWMQEPATTTNWTQRTAEQILTEAFISDAPWNESRWNNPEFDELVRSAISEADVKRRVELYAAAIRLVRYEGGTIIPYHVKRSRVVAANVTGIGDGVNRFRVPWHEVSIVSDPA